MYKLQWTEHSANDYKSLDGDQKVFVDKALDRIRLRGMQAGEALHGNLAGCNKLKNNQKGLRVIFKEVNGEMQLIEIVIIGKRDKKKVYKEAKDRL